MDITKEEMALIEKEGVQRIYKELIASSEDFLKKEDEVKIHEAYELAKEHHGDIRRKSGELYIHHPLRVAKICVQEIGLRTTSIIAALLHDLVEDTEITLDDIEKKFGSEISNLVNGLTKIKNITRISSIDTETFSNQAENFRKIISTIAEDARIILIKLADRLDNMRSLEYMPAHKQIKICSETSYFYVPLAHRMGLYNIKSELEDICLKYTDPTNYHSIIEKIERIKDEQEGFIETVKGELKIILDTKNIPYKIFGRIKSVSSILHKIVHKKVNFYEIYDIFGIRIVLDVQEDKEQDTCFDVYRTIKKKYYSDEERLRDWISTPKSNGYEALHATVMSHQGKWVEIQIRTKRMDEIAEKGVAAHWKYKNKNHPSENESKLDAWFHSLKQILNTSEKEDISAVEFMEQFRLELDEEQIFVYTRKGELKELPKGSTVLDFAFSIHEDLGTHCIGAKVNQKLVSLEYKLRNAEQVEVLTTHNAIPSLDWLNKVITSRAKKYIIKHLSDEDKTLINNGKEILIEILKKNKQSYSEELLYEMKKYFSIKHSPDLFYKLNSGIISSTDIEYFISTRHNNVQTDSFYRNTEKLIERLQQEKNKKHIEVGETYDFIHVSVAKNCCFPIKGDTILGILNVGEIMIHKQNCPEAIKTASQFADTIIKAQWSELANQKYLIAIKLTGIDRMGMVNDVTKVISEDMNVNMKSIKMQTNGSIFDGEINVYVHDLKEISYLIQKLQNIPSMYDVCLENK